ncbi:MAG: trypsin-like peptidase domain-containing protein [Ruminococcus sp.]|nr:trypsin-like peptidase domain-containing protein [Ruminococcus sp.]
MRRRRQFTGTSTAMEVSSISSSTDVSSSDADLNALIGTNDRYTDNALNGIVRISMNCGYGTGFVVDEHTIATATHCVYTHSSGSDSDTYITGIRFYDDSGELEKVIYDPVEYHVPYYYITAVLGDSNENQRKYDYALITVEDDLSDYMCFNLGTVLDDFISSDTLVYVTGYLDTTRKTGEGNAISEEEISSLYSKANTSFTLFYDCDTEGGTSGGPVYIKTSFRGQEYIIQ